MKRPHQITGREAWIDVDHVRAVEVLRATPRRAAKVRAILDGQWATVAVFTHTGDDIAATTSAVLAAHELVEACSSPPPTPDPDPAPAPLRIRIVAVPELSVRLTPRGRHVRTNRRSRT